MTPTNPTPLTEAEAILDRLIDGSTLELTFAHPEGEPLVVEQHRYPHSFTTATLYRAQPGGHTRVAFRTVNPQNPRAPRELFLADLTAREEQALRMLAATAAVEIAAAKGGVRADERIRGRAAAAPLGSPAAADAAAHIEVKSEWPPHWGRPAERNGTERSD